MPEYLVVGGIAVYLADRSGILISGCGRRYDIFEENRYLVLEVDILEGAVMQVEWYFRHSEIFVNSFRAITSASKLALPYTIAVSLCISRFDDILTMKI